MKTAGVNKKGYRREHLHDLWTRYLPPAAGGYRYQRYLRYRAGQRAGEVTGSAWQAGTPLQATPLVTSAVAEVADVTDPPGAG